MKARITLLTLAFLLCSLHGNTQDLFSLNPDLEGQHPRILFTAEEASTRAMLVREYLPDDWDNLINECTNINYPTGSVWPQKIWWYFSRLGTGIAMTENESYIEKGKSWLNTAYNEDWGFSSATVGLDEAHKLAGFAFLYDCMYPYLSDELRSKYEDLMADQLVIFRETGYDLNDYWTNDYQNNHMHFRAAASLYCSIILSDKRPSLQSEFDYTMTVWRYITHMAPPDGSNHEGLNYSNYGGQMLYPAIAALKHCTDMDPTVEDHYRNVGYYYLYHVTPGYTSGFGFGDAANAAVASGPNYLFQIAAETQDPYINYLAHRLREDHPDAFYLSQWPVLYIDPTLDQLEPDRLPLHRYFEDLGVVIARSSWEADATGVAFKCGPMGGHLLNDTRGTEYSHYTDYINVAHDDPDAGTFLLFSKGSFLTEGDGYETTAKVSQNHSTFIVDDETQPRSGGGWSQPPSIDQLARQKDVFAVNDRVVFTGDMTGVYSDMQKLERTFVSHKAGYILIYDKALSDTDGRTFEWRLQTTGDLNKVSDKTWNVVNGEANALTHILQPAEALWDTLASGASQIDGKILRMRLDAQQENNFLVMIQPNGASLDAITESYETPEYNGVKLSGDEKNEYTLFKNETVNQSSLDNFSFNASTLLLVEQETGPVLESVLAVNGDSLSYGDQFAFYADMPLNFGLDSMDSDGAEIRLRIAPSSGTTIGQTAHIELGKLIPNTSYSIFLGDDSIPLEMISDANGIGGFDLVTEEEISILISKQAVNPTALEQLISEAQWLYDQSVEGSYAGEYLPDVRAFFLEAIDSANVVLDSFTLQEEVDQAVVDLDSAMEEFMAGVNLDLSVLQALIDEANDLHNSAEEGEEEGMYELGSKAVFLESIQMAEGIAGDPSAQEEVDEAVLQLIEAIYGFKSAVMPPQPLSVFSDIALYGDIQNYFLNTESLWEVVMEDDDAVVGMLSYSTDFGQYMLVKDSVFTNFDLEFEARAVDGIYTNDIMIVLGYQDDDNYSFVKLSEKYNESGVFTKAGTSVTTNWYLLDYRTYAVANHLWATYRVISQDSVITAYREGVELFSVEGMTDVHYSGQVGLGTWYMNRAYFDEVRLTRLSSLLGVEDKAVPEIRCYPNPVDNILILEGMERISEIRLFDCTGAEMKSQSFQSAQEQRHLDLENLPAGIYFLQYVHENGGTGHERIVKN